MRVLMIDQEAKDKVAQVVTFAREHVWYPTPNGPSPGDDPGFVCYLNTYRCVFSYTKSPETGLLYRQLSISVPSDGYPCTAAVCVIAELFGFTGAEQGIEAQVGGGNWVLHVESREPHCVVLAEELVATLQPVLGQPVLGLA
jgi:hypothetical protein